MDFPEKPDDLLNTAPSVFIPSWELDEGCTWEGHPVLPMSEVNTVYQVDISFPPACYDAMCAGYVPQPDGPLFFVYFADGILNFHRAVSGVCEYQVFIEKTPDACRITNVIQNDDPDQCRFAVEDSESARRVIALIHFLLFEGRNCLPVVELPYGDTCEYDEVFDAVLREGDMALEIGARFYDAGLECAQEKYFKQAEFWYTRASDMGNTQATCNLGYVYQYGRTGEVDEKAAFQMFSDAAQSGHIEGCYKLGDMYAQGIGTEKDEARAFFLYCRAREMAFAEDEMPGADASVSFRLAGCYEHGRGCEADPHLAEAFYRAAERRFFEAIYDQGDEYYRGNLDRAREGVVRMAKLIAASKKDNPDEKIRINPDTPAGAE